MQNCPHFRSIQFALALSCLENPRDLHDLELDRQSSDCFCFTCMRQMPCGELRQHYADTDNEHHVYLLKTGVIYCATCDCAHFSYSTSNKHYQQFIHSCRALYCSDMKIDSTALNPLRLT